MNSIRRIGLLASRKSVGQSSRKLYTDSIYPYPFNYINKRWPSQFCYRETYPCLSWKKTEGQVAEGMAVFFWTYIWCNVFADPLVFLGHYNMPDPTAFTDEELGIPPDEAGSYKDWLAQREAK